MRNIILLAIALAVVITVLIIKSKDKNKVVVKPSTTEMLDSRFISKGITSLDLIKKKIEGIHPVAGKIAYLNHVKYIRYIQQFSYNIDLINQITVTEDEQTAFDVEYSSQLASLEELAIVERGIALLYLIKDYINPDYIYSINWLIPFETNSDKLDKHFKLIDSTIDIDRVKTILKSIDPVIKRFLKVPIAVNPNIQFNPFTHDPYLFSKPNTIFSRGEVERIQNVMPGEEKKMAQFTPTESSVGMYYILHDEIVPKYISSIQYGG